MPIIYTYPSVAPASGDYLLISDISETTPANATRKCTIGDVVDLVTALVPGGGTVTEVILDPGATGLVIGGSPITTDGTFTIGGTLGVVYGGSGNNISIAGPLHGNGTGAFTGSDIILDTGGTSEVSGVLPMANGGSGISSYVKGDIIYAPDSEGITAMAKLGIGTANQTLVVSGSGIPSWVGASTIAVTSIDVSGGSTGLTFSGGPITSTGTITMAGTLAVANGGTGVTTLTNGGILLGSAASAITATSQPTNGQLLIGWTGSDPVLSQLTAGANITITNTAGGIEIVGAASGGDGMYGGSGALSGDVTVTTGANDLTFTATTGNVTFNNASSSPVFFIDGAANKVGIGTASPNSTLELESSSGDIVIELDNNAAGSSNFQIQCGAGNARADLVLDDNLHITMKGQRVGIINTNPSYTFDVLGDGHFTTNLLVGGSVGIGTVLPSANADLTLEGGTVAIKETTTPTADADYGKVYCKADNKLYFQDGAGVEHEIAFV